MSKTEILCRRLLLKLLHPLIVWVGKQHIPFTHKLMTGLHFFDLFPKLKKGMVFTTRIEGELTNLTIPGFYTHAAIYAGGFWVIEAVGAGVVKTDIISFLLKKDYVLCRKPTFVTEETMAAAADWAMTQIGKPYDYEFQSTIAAFYCSELIGACYAEVNGGTSPFEMRTTLGEPTIVPDDIAKADKLWVTMWDSRTAELTSAEVIDDIRMVG